MGIEGNQYCIAFPYLRLDEPLDIEGIQLDPVNLHDVDPDHAHSQLLKHIPWLAQQYFGTPSFNFSAATFTSEKGLTNELRERYDMLILLRFLLLTEEFPFQYQGSEFMFIQLREDDIFEGYLNGLEPISGFLGERGITSYETVPESSTDHCRIRMGLNDLRSSSEDRRKLIANAAQRYVLACGPSRYLDGFLKVVGVVSGIERFLGLTPNDGSEVFGKKLAERLKLPILKSWGKQAYTLRSSFVHQNSDLPVDTYAIYPEGVALFDNPNESFSHTSHLRIGLEVLKELIIAEFKDVNPSGESIQKLLYSNELVIKKIRKLIDARKPLGECYFAALAEFDGTRGGGKLEDKKCIARFLFKELHRLYPDCEQFETSRLTFKQPRTLFHNMEIARKALDTMRWPESGPALDNMSEWNILTSIEHFLEKFEFTLFRDLLDATSPRNK